MGLSDGARIDILRHSNVGLLTNEQLVVATQVDKDKWQDLLDNLRKDLRDSEAKFRLVYLIDDFAGTGNSFIRYNKEKARWTGKLLRFLVAPLNRAAKPRRLAYLLIPIAVLQLVMKRLDYLPPP